MFKINQKVKSKNPNGEVKDAGIIVGIYNCNFYLNYILPKNAKIEDIDYMWSKNNPNWKNELLYIVLFDEDHYSCTLEEWIISGKNQGYSEQELRDNYFNSCPKRNCLILPENDLKLVRSKK